MPIREVIRMGHPTLRQVAKSVDGCAIGSPNLEDLIEDMRETLRAYGGIGLAAPQIDVSLQLAVIQIDDGPTRYGRISMLPFTVYINPVVTVLNEESEGYWEGCLSIPGMMGFVERPQHILVDYLNRKGEAEKIELRGFHATVFQHEFDHLQGKLYVDRMQDTRLFAFDEEYRAYHQQPDTAATG